MIRTPLAVGLMCLVVLPAARSAEPALAPGKWALVEGLAPNQDREVVVVTIGLKDGKPAVTAVEGDDSQWTAKDLTVTGRHVRFTITRVGPINYQFDGLFDPADPTRVLGSLMTPGSFS